MKNIISQKVGGDGGVAALAIDDSDNTLVLELKYPLEKLMEPVNKVLDNAFGKLEDVIPGDWDKAVLEPIRMAAHAELMSLLASAPAPAG